MPISDIYGLRAALENIMADQDMRKRHARIGNACRKALTDAGLKLYLESGFSNTVTVFEVPKDVLGGEILRSMREDHGILLAGSLEGLQGEVIRIGHMGSNANQEDMTETMEALDRTLRNLGVSLKEDLGERFRYYL